MRRLVATPSPQRHRDDDQSGLGTDASPARSSRDTSSTPTLLRAKRGT